MVILEYLNVLYENTFFLISIGLILIISWWKIFEKAGQPGWLALIPIWNVIVFFGIANLSPLTLILFFIPIVNIFAIPMIMAILMIKLAKSFDRSVLFALGLLFLNPLFMLILAFNSSQYSGNRNYLYNVENSIKVAKVFIGIMFLITTVFVIKLFMEDIKDVFYRGPIVEIKCILHEKYFYHEEEINYKMYFKNDKIGNVEKRMIFKYLEKDIETEKEIAQYKKDNYKNYNKYKGVTFEFKGDFPIDEFILKYNIRKLPIVSGVVSIDGIVISPEVSPEEIIEIFKGKGYQCEENIL